MLEKPPGDGDAVISHVEKMDSRDPVGNLERSGDDSIHADPEAGVGQERLKKIGYIQFTVLLIVEAIALGTLGMPSAFAALGMALGIVLTLFFGLISIYMAYILGQVKLNNTDVKSFPDLGRLLFGNPGYWVTDQSEAKERAPG